MCNLSKFLCFLLLGGIFNSVSLLPTQAQGTAPVLTNSNGTVIAPRGANGGIRTGMDAPTNTHLPAKINTFDWRTPTYNINWNGGTTGVDNPFYQINNASINHLFESKDMLPEDGWELFAREFGYNDAGIPLAQKVGIPILILYNRYTGLFRVFVMRHEYYPYSHVRFQMSFLPNTGGMETALMDLVRPIDALNRTHIKEPENTSMDRFLAENGAWHFTEFPMVYDPCTCFYKSKIIIKVSFITQSQINLSGSINGNITNINNGSGTANKTKFWSWSNFSTLTGKLGEVFKGVGDLTSLLKSSVDGSPMSSAEKNDRKANIDSLGVKMKAIAFVKVAGSALSLVSKALGLVDFFVAGGKKGSGTQEVKLSPMAITMSVQLSGTISSITPHKEITRWNSGSTGATVADGEYPYYNETMGIFNLIERPVARRKVTTQRLIGATRDQISTITTSSYQIANDIKWTLNPAAGLEAQEIYASFIVERPTSVSGAPSTSDLPWIADGVDVLTGRMRYSSPLFDIGCLKNKIMEIESSSGSEIWGWQAPNTNFRIRITAILKRTDNAPNAQNVLFTAVYPLNVENFTGTLNPHDMSACTTLIPAQTASQIRTFCTSSIYTANRFHRPEEVRATEEAIAESKDASIDAVAYPNPSNDNLNVDIMGNPETMYEVNLYNAYGFAVYQGEILRNQTKIDTKNLKEGMYILHIRSGNREVRKKIVIKH